MTCSERLSETRFARNWDDLCPEFVHGTSHSSQYKIHSALFKVDFP